MTQLNRARNMVRDYEDCSNVTDPLFISFEDWQILDLYDEQIASYYYLKKMMYDDFAYTWPVTKYMINEMLAYVDMRDLSDRDYEFMRNILGKTYKRLCKWCCQKECL